MNEELGNKILKIRKDNNLTQKELADKLGVTYQSVSKWERGINIPDLVIIRQICKEFNIDINDMLDTPKKNNKKYKYKYILIGIAILIVIILIISLLLFNKKDKNDDFKFKTISTSCEKFNITGSIAYNSKKSSIYISNVDYCGEEENVKYKKIDCRLVDSHSKDSKVITTCNYDIKEPQTLDDYLKNINIKVDNFSTMCSEYKDNHLKLEIKAYIDDNKSTTYEIPLEFKNNCNN